jgi:NADH-quinone oxidoreductase E subunit
MSPALQPQFSKQRLTEIAELVKRYPATQSALLPVLHMAQTDFGYLSMEVQYLVAATLGIRIMAVREVVTFYTMFREKPCGKYLLEVCTSAGCQLNGADALVKQMCDKLGIKVGQTTADDMFTVTEVECAGACGGAPVVQVNNIYYERATMDSMDKVIADARAEGGAQ